MTWIPWVCDVLALAGAGCITGAAFLCSPALGLLALGLVLMAVGLLGARMMAMRNRGRGE